MRTILLLCLWLNVLMFCLNFAIGAWPVAVLNAAVAWLVFVVLDEKA